MMSPRPLVDYQEAARKYDAGRALNGDALDTWKRAVEDVIGPVSSHSVIDVGAGTGIFAAAWTDWGAARVTAIEPSPEMRAQAFARPGRRFEVMAGDAANIPVPDGSATVCWMSAVVHHIPDRPAAMREVARVLKPGGHLLIRGFSPGLSRIPWLDALPGRERSEARFPSSAETERWFSSGPFHLVETVQVVERASTSSHESADWIAKMRNADSLLTALTDEEVEGGLRHLLAQPDHDLGPLELSLLVFERDR